MRVLLVEDDRSTALAVSQILCKADCDCDTTGLGKDGVELAGQHDYDVIILDLWLPDIDGFEVIRRLRSAAISTPTLILSGYDDIDAKVKCLQLGADDYLSKPYHQGELAARIQALMRRSQGRSDAVIRAGNLAVNMDTKQVSVLGTDVPLTRHEYQILEFLALRKGSIVSKNAILNNLYGGTDGPKRKIIEVFVCKIRQKLGSGGGAYIHTVYGQGYVMRDQEEGSTTASTYQDRL